MAETQRGGLAEKEIEQAITLLKKGAYLLKYGRRGKPKFCPFHLSNATFQRYPRPEKEYQSFSLIYNDRSLDLICKDKDEAEVWLVGLKALITRGTHSKWKLGTINCSTSSDSPRARIRKTSPTVTPFDFGDIQGTQVPLDNVSNNGLGKAFADIISYTEAANTNSRADSVSFSPSPLTNAFPDNSNDRSSAAETFRISLSSVVSSSSHGSAHEDFDSLGDVFIWGEGIANGFLGGGEHRVGYSFSRQTDALLPKAVESTMALDVHNIACGARHAVLVTKQGEIFSWGEESGGRLGHGREADVSHPQLIEILSGVNVELVACGEYHTCAVTRSGDLYTWGDGTYNSGLLGHGSKVSCWIPRKVSGNLDGIHLSYISCGLWHTAVVTSAGHLFTFGDGSFGALGHGDHISTSIPREVETLRGLRTTRVSCGVWHTAAVVVATDSSSSSPSGSTSCGKLFTWGDGDKGRLGHGDKEPRLFPECVAPLIDENICQVACGHDLSVALTTSGHVYTMGSTAYGQLGVPVADGLVPTRVDGEIAESFVEEVACGAYHVAALTSTSKVYTWGKGANGQLGHGDKDNRNSPTLVDFLKDKQVKRVVCGLNFTAIICLHKWVSSVDHSVCSRCHNPFGFRRKRHNCYNCGLVFCKACSSRKSLKAALAPSINKAYRVCDDCFTKLKETDTKLKRTSGYTSVVQSPRNRTGNVNHKTAELADREAQGPRLQDQLSILSSFDSNKQTESRLSKQNLKLELQDNHVYPVNKNLQMGRIYSPKSSIFLAKSSKKKFSASASSSRMSSLATSPVSGKSSSARSSAVTIDDSKQMNDSLNQEIIKLRAQVEELTSKSEHLEAELERTSKQLKTVTAIAEDEAEKCKTANEVIKSLTVQLKKMAEKSPEGASPSFTSGSTARHPSGVRTTYSTESQKTNTTAPASESNSNSAQQNLSHVLQLKKMAEKSPEGASPSFTSGSTARHPSGVRTTYSTESQKTSTTAPASESNSNSAQQNLSHGTKVQTERKERMVQAESGVYITLSTLPGGGNEVKRVRFSRKHFTEQEAEKWWSENGAKICERYNIRSSH
ncbi:PH, RCC1 and FYVE domains-containing protein 1 isoform X2 [Citrus sinensis]|uniref:PH, RCC1 and FYVE domains-containing protein 1 isoform X2 n=1 Tax=Citrus sinensis TaxID=2711 RepID=UPI002278BEB0|nr:PH, RCC1 and FYVE domains-containing protein 1 isoform X2 [Citrus sinensis]